MNEDSFKLKWPSPAEDELSELLRLIYRYNVVTSTSTFEKILDRIRRLFSGFLLPEKSSKIMYAHVFYMHVVVVVILCYCDFIRTSFTDYFELPFNLKWTA